MAKGSRGGRSRMSSRQYRATASPYPLLRRFDDSGDIIPKKTASWLDKKEWEDVTCSVCMEFPHNAVLLLCSSHDKGCRPFMCGTSFRHSNCLDQYKKAYTKSPAAATPDRTSSAAGDELACPLCRGQVKGWTVVEPAREFLNLKCRSCVHDECSFVGTYKELRRHVRSDHPSRRPREVDPALEQKWRRLEREQERNDVISTITSAMPGAMFFGDYVIENGNGNGNAPIDVDSDSDDDDNDVAGVERNPGFDSNLVNVFLLLHAFGPPGGDELNRRIHHHHHNTTPVGGSESSEHDDDVDDDVDDVGGEMSLGRRLRRHNGIVLGRAGRRRRRRDVNVNNVNVNGGGSR